MKQVILQTESGEPLVTNEAGANEILRLRRLLDDARAQKPLNESIRLVLREALMDGDRYTPQVLVNLDRALSKMRPLYAAPVPAQPAAKMLYSFGADRVIRKHTTDNTKGIYVAELIGWDAGLLGDMLNSAPGAHPPDTYFKQPAAVPEAVAKDALEDLADTVSKALGRAWSLGQTYWIQADSESYSQNRKSIETQSKFHELVDTTRAAILSAADTEVKNG